MTSTLDTEKLKRLLQPLITASSLWAGKNLFALIVANPEAGGFTQKKHSMLNLQVLEKAASSAPPSKSQLAYYELKRTTVAGDGKKITDTFLEQIFQNQKKMPDDLNLNEYLIVTAGGDGTSLEVQTALAEAAFLSKELLLFVQKKLAVLRLPLGTGNDGSDGFTLSEALKRLTEDAVFALQPVVKVLCQDGAAQNSNNEKMLKYGSLSNKSPWYAFNIASIGIDAFITHMTNSTKKILPGNFYKLWIDLACVFYDLRFPAKPIDIEVFDKDGHSILHINEPVTFCLLGASGHRTYGSGQRILPDDRTVCIALKMGLFSKLIMKKKFVTGRHIHSSKALFAHGEKIIVHYDQYILVQMDGEVHLLYPEHFPLTFERSEPIIRIIKLQVKDTKHKKNDPPLI